jgi:uncharacterized protein (DUF1800 family)
LLALLLDHPATARRIAWRICTMFFGEVVVGNAALDELASGLKEHKLDIDWAVGTVLRSQLFFSAANLRTRILGPVEYVVGALHALGLCHPPPSTLLLADWTSRMGQDLLRPPNVGGWPEGRSWLGSRSIIARANFAAALAEGRLWSTSSKPGLAGAMPREHRTRGVETMVRSFAELLWGEGQSVIFKQCLADVENVDGADAQASAAIYWLLTHPESQIG